MDKEVKKELTEEIRKIQLESREEMGYINAVTDVIGEILAISKDYPDDKEAFGKEVLNYIINKNKEVKELMDKHHENQQELLKKANEL